MPIRHPGEDAKWTTEQTSLEAKGVWAGDRKPGDWVSAPMESAQDKRDPERSQVHAKGQTIGWEEPAKELRGSNLQGREEPRSQRRGCGPEAKCYQQATYAKDCCHGGRWCIWQEIKAFFLGWGHGAGGAHLNVVSLGENGQRRSRENASFTESCHKLKQRKGW